MGERDRQIQGWLQAGVSRSEIARWLGVTRETVSRIAAQVGFPSRARYPSPVDWQAVQMYYNLGHSIETCKRKFGFSSSSWSAAVCRGDIAPRRSPTQGGPRGETQERVARLLAAGHRPAEVSRRLGISKPTVCYHARKLGIAARSAPAKRFDWALIREAYDSGLSVRECMDRFGFSSSAWSDAVARGAVVPRARELPLSRLLVVGRPGTNRCHLKQRLIKAGLKENRCEICGVTEWLGKPLSMELHHVNGDGTDNRLENLQLLCANCHSQTDNWGGRGARGNPSRTGR